jgi:hypothetical protein
MHIIVLKCLLSSSQHHIEDPSAGQCYEIIVGQKWSLRQGEFWYAQKCPVRDRKSTIFYKFLTNSLIAVTKASTNHSNSCLEMFWSNLICLLTFSGTLGWKLSLFCHIFHRWYDGG